MAQWAKNRIIRTFLSYLAIVGIGILFCIVAVPLLLLPARYRLRNRFLFWCMAASSRLVLAASGITVHVHQTDHVPIEPAVFVMNHASALDILLIEGFLKAQPRVWLSKGDYKTMPVLNWFLHRLHVFVTAHDVASAARSLREVHARAAAGSGHVLIFPEGARFDDGQIHPFFKGFSLLAAGLHRPVVPIYIAGAEKVYPRGSVLIRADHAIDLYIGPAFVRETGESHEMFTARVHEWFVMSAQFHQEG